jgi:hypothetical protein
LTELQRHAAKVAAKPADWMPWNYRAALETATAVAGEQLAAIASSGNVAVSRGSRAFSRL